MGPPPRARQWRIALVLGIATGIASMLLIPYVAAVTGAPVRTRGLPLAVIVPLGGLQSTVVGVFLAWAGLRLGASLGLDAPLLRAWTERRAFSEPTHFVLATVVGAATGAVELTMDPLIFARVISSDVAAAMRAAARAHHATRWQGALASFYGGIGEEVQLRLFLMTLVAWVIAKVTRSKAPAVFVFANVVAALAFGAGHLPLAATAFGSLNAAIVVRTVALNAFAGVVFGELYRRYGLEHAMVAHFWADIVLHVIVGG